MKGIFLLLLLLLSITGFSQKKKDHSTDPPGTVRINDTLFFDKTEIPNISWREWIAYLQQIKKDSTAARQVLPDTLVWTGPESPLADYYFRHPSFNYYPVVGISYEQAVEFCKWRTYAANQARYFKENKIKDFRKHLTDSFPIKFYYRLPTKEEWESIAMASLNSASVPAPIKETKEQLYNTREWRDSLANKKDPHDLTTFFTLPVNALYPNSLGLYNMIGNVSEMVAERGIAKGGGFIHSRDSSTFQLEQHYTNPERWLGFRCIAVKLQ